MLSLGEFGAAGFGGGWTTQDQFPRLLGDVNGDGMDDIIGRCEEKIGRGKKLLDHPILGPLTGTQWRKFHLVHGLHHVKQIRRLRGSGG